MRLVRWVVCVLLVCAPPLHAHAQAPTATLRGVVYDSLRSTPLRDAVVRATAGSVMRMANTDERGRFHLDSLPLGAVDIAVEHAVLDSIGLYEVTAQFAHDGKREHRMGVPSFATLSRAVCGRVVPLDSAVIYGALRRADGSAARNARVELSWDAAVRTTDGKLAQRRLTFATTTDSLGRYTACGVAADEPLAFRARASDDSLSQVAIALPARSSRVLRQEATLSSRETGVVRGVVRGEAGEPVAGARVLLDTAEVRTDSAGRFFARDVPTGSRPIEVTAVGRAPQALLATVSARDTVELTVTLTKATTLETVKTEATVLSELTRSMEERKRIGLGQVRDSLEIASAPSLVAALSSFRGVTARTGRGGIPLITLPKAASLSTGQSGCVARLYLDGRPVSWDYAVALLPRDIAWLEVYPRGSQLPAEFQATTMGDACGVVAIMTKWKIGR